MAARACVDAAVAEILATGGGVREAATLAAAHLQRGGHAPRAERTLIGLVRENDAFRRAATAMADAADRAAAARIVAGEPGWVVARMSRHDLARSRQPHPPGQPAALGGPSSGSPRALGGSSAALRGSSAAPVSGSAAAPLGGSSAGPVGGASMAPPFAPFAPLGRSALAGSPAVPAPEPQSVQQVRGGGMGSRGGGRTLHHSRACNLWDSGGGVLIGLFPYCPMPLPPLGGALMACKDVSWLGAE